jgi:tRNA pseudouridine38-40 synthase
MPRYKLVLEYAGTRYSGWQIQENARTVQGELMRAARVVSPRGRLELKGAGRTDAGVHALAQVAHLDLALTLPGPELVDRLNASLPFDINVLEATLAPSNFHARHDAVGRRYLYRISTRRTAFGKPFVWWVRERLDLDLMRYTAAVLVGFHDFRAFAVRDPAAPSTLVELQAAEVTPQGDLVLVRLQASHFLWKMVRRIVGTLVEIGRGGLNTADVQAWLTEDSLVPARLTAPASGLFLEAVLYPVDQRRRASGVERDGRRAGIISPQEDA